MAASDRVDSGALGKLRWRCRRGLLENDLFIERYFNRHAATLTEGQAEGLMALMDLSDNDLLDLLLARKEPEGEWVSGEVLRVLGELRHAPLGSAPTGEETLNSSLQ